MSKIYVEGIAEKLNKRQARVKSGDTLSKIALGYTRNANNWRKILEHNSLTSDKIKPGQVIDIPQHLFNPEFNINGESVRWRSNRYKELYPNLVEVNNEGVDSRTLPEVTISAGNNYDMGEHVRKMGGVAAGRILPAIGIGVGSVSSAGSMLGALPFTANPTLTIGGGLGGSLLGGHLVNRGVRDLTNYTSWGDMASKTVAQNPRTEVVSSGVVRGNGSTINSGKGEYGWKQSNTPVNRGHQSAGYSGKDVVIQSVKSPVMDPVVPTFNGRPIIPFPPILPTTTPPVTPQPARLEVINPENITLDKVIRDSGAQPGDTLVMPSGEEIQYLPGNTNRVRTFNVGDARTYDATPNQQYLIPGFNQTVYGYKGNGSVGKYTPPVNPAEVRGQSVVYPYVVPSQATYKRRIY